MPASLREPLVICGIGCRFPGSSNNPQQFWRSLLNGKDCVSEVENGRWNRDYFTNADKDIPASIRTSRCGFIDRLEHFDFESFNISKREAENMDIQQKLLLETTLCALEDSRFNYGASVTGVYVGIGQTEQFESTTHDLQSIGPYSVTGSTLSIAANRISYVFDLRGPSMSVDTACSSSVTAFHLACEAIHNRECSQAIVAGVNALTNPSVMIQFSQLGVLSSDGRCKSFSDAADGYVRSEGCGVIIIRKLSDALRDNNPIYAVVKGSACNQDGHLSPSLTMPSGESQMTVFKAACERANIDPKQVFFAEAHATGTKVGDPIEANAIGTVFGAGRKVAPSAVVNGHCSDEQTSAPDNRLRLGSVKSNVGHLETASFMASIIKVLLMLQHETLVPNLYFDPDNANKSIRFDEFNLQVQTEVERFRSAGALMTISSFGFGGSNGCVLIEGFDRQNVGKYFEESQQQQNLNGLSSFNRLKDLESDKENEVPLKERNAEKWSAESEPSSRSVAAAVAAQRKLTNGTYQPVDCTDKPLKPSAAALFDLSSLTHGSISTPSAPYLFMVSAATPAALDARLAQIQQKSTADQPSLIAQYRAAGYTDFDIAHTLNAGKLHRQVAVGVGSSIDNALFALPRKLADGNSAAPLIWVFAGQGPQHYEMGRRLYQRYPVFKQSIDECDAIYQQVSGGISIVKNVGLFGDHVAGANPKAVYSLTYTLPCLVFLQVALCDLYASFGIQPSAVIGHSFGEMAAAYAAKVCGKKQIVVTAYHRARLLMQIDGAGVMMAVGGAPVELIEGWCSEEPQCWIAAYNGPQSCTVGGIKESVARIAVKCQQNNYFHRVLKITNAYHTPLMSRVRDEALDIFKSTLAECGEPLIPYMSTVTKQWKTTRFNGQYTWDGIEGAVHFSDGIKAILDRFGNDAVFMEMSAHPVLSSYLTENGVKNACYTMHREQNDAEATLKAIATLRCHHFDVDMSRIYGTPSQAKVIPFFLPYPFEVTGQPCHREDMDHKMQRQIPNFLPLAGIPLPHPTQTYISKISSKIIPFTVDHCVQGPIVFPGAGYIEMAMEMLNSTALTHITIGRALIVPSDNSQYRHVRSTVEEKRDEKSLSQASWSEVTICSKGNDYDQGAWVQHTTARKYISSNLAAASLKHNTLIPTAPSLPAWCSELPSACSSIPLTSKSVYDRFKSVGLVYGPLFQGVETMYTGDNCAWANMNLQRIKADLDKLTPLKRYHLHPALLDSCFHVLLGTVRYFYLPFVPTYIERIQWFVSRETVLPDEILCFARSHTIDPEKGVIEGEIVVSDNDGRVLGHVEGMQCTALGKADANTIQPTLTSTWQSFDYPTTHSKVSIDSVHWKAAFLDSAAAFYDQWQQSTQSFVNSLRQTLMPQQLSSQQKLSTMESVMDAACVAYISKFLQQHGEKLDISSWPADRKRFWNWMKQLVATSQNIDSAAIQRVESLRPLFGLEVEGIQRVGENLYTLLTDSLAVQNILFAPNDPFMAQLYSESLTFGPFVSIAAALIVDCINQNPDRVFHILEVGAGTGAFTRAILKVLPEDLVKRRLKYIFSDVSNKFIKDAKSKFGDFTCIDYAIVDIENLEQCTVPMHSVDLVLGFDVVHVAGDLSTALSNVQRLLSPNGLMCLVELTRPHVWTQMLFGLFKQWWGMTDDRTLITLTKQQWIDKLDKEGFHSIHVLNDAEQATQKEFCHSIVLAQSKQLSFQSSEMPVSAGDLTVFDAAAPDSNINTLLAAAHVLIKKLPSTIPHPSERQRFALITTQSQTVAAASPIEPLHADLIGFTRVLASEFANQIDVIQIDLPHNMPQTDRARWVRGLIELARVNREREFVVSAEGQLLAPRFVSYTPKQLTPTVKDSQVAQQQQLPPFRLEVNTPGQLSTLRFHLLNRQPVLEPNQIRVAVRASALNFKDLMIALGMLNNPMGLDVKSLAYDPTVQLGLEFSGVIQEVGSAVSQYNAGDEVFGLSKWCFANQVVTDSEFVALKPAHMSHTEAVSIPIVFATSYAGLIDKAQLNKDDVVLVHSAAGGIGQAAIQLCRHVGCRVIATVGSNEKRQFLSEKYGVTQFANSHDSAEWERQVMAMTGGKGVSVVINSLKGDAITRGLRCLSIGGRFVEIGKIDILASHSLDMRLLLNDISFHSVQLDILMNTTKTRIQQYMQAVAELAEQRHIIPLVDSVYACSQYEQAFRYLMSGNHKGKIILDFSPEKQIQVLQSNQLHATNQLFNTNTVYMLSGGTGALALQLTEFMCKRGARYLLLFSRRGEGSLRKSELENLKDIGQRSGAKILVQTCDVTDRNSIQQNYAVAVNQHNFPTARVAILHLAMVLDDDNIPKMTPERMQRAMKCKVDGAKNLIQSFAAHKIDFTVFFSSAASTLGNPSQANYGAANSFLDSYACYLNHSLGIRARVVNLGVIEDVGILAEDYRLKQVLVAKGFSGGLSSSSIPLLMEQMLLYNNNAQFVYGAFDWHQVCESYPALTTRFNHLIDYKALHTSADSFDSSSALSVSSLSALIGNMLGVAADALDPADSLTLQGLDSLLAVELSSTLKKKFGLGVSQMELLGGMSINDLVAKGKAE